MCLKFWIIRFNFSAIYRLTMIKLSDLNLLILQKSILNLDLLEQNSVFTPRENVEFEEPRAEIIDQRSAVRFPRD